MSEDNSGFFKTVIAPTERVAQGDNTLMEPRGRAIELPIGYRLAEFEITELVGIGGFGIVYKALDHSLGREVALKEYLPTSLATRSDAQTVSVTSERHRESFTLGLRSFVNEAKILAKFDNPSLAKVHRFWEANGTAYMAMTFYRGQTLKQALALMQGPPPQAWLRQLIANLLDALEVLHGDNYLHRDVAPDNILLLESGRPILLDLGAARLVIQNVESPLTVILKPGYAPPEQYTDSSSMRQGPWTDLYALAAVVYYAITGKAPMPSIGRMMNDGLVPLRQLLPSGYDVLFLAGIDRALSIKPEDRPQSVAEMRAILNVPGDSIDVTQLAGAFMGDERPAPPPPKKSWLLPSAIGAACLAAAGTIGIVMTTRQQAGTTPPAVAAAKPADSTLPPTAATTPAGPNQAAPPLTPGAPPPTTVAAAPTPAAEQAATAASALVAALGGGTPGAATPPDARLALQQIHAQRSPDHQVSIKLEKPTVKVGKDSLGFRVDSSKAGYVYILMVGTDGKHFNLLFPNEIDKNNRIKAGQELKLPRPGWALTADGPPGIDSFVAIVSEHPRDFSGAGLRRIDSFGEFPLPTVGSEAMSGAAGMARYAGKPVCAAAANCSGEYGAALFEIEEQR